MKKLKDFKEEIDKLETRPDLYEVAALKVNADHISHDLHGISEKILKCGPPGDGGMVSLEEIQRDLDGIQSCLERVAEVSERLNKLFPKYKASLLKITKEISNTQVRAAIAWRKSLIAGRAKEIQDLKKKIS